MAAGITLPRPRLLCSAAGAAGPAAQSSHAAAGPCRARPRRHSLEALGRSLRRLSLRAGEEPEIAVHVEQDAVEDATTPKPQGGPSGADACARAREADTPSSTHTHSRSAHRRVKHVYGEVDRGEVARTDGTTARAEGPLP